MTTFETIPPPGLERLARALLMHVEAASEREGLEYPSEAQHLSDELQTIDSMRRKVEREYDGYRDRARGRHTLREPL